MDCGMREPEAVKFETTSWTLVLSARNNAQDLGVLLSRYWSPIYCYIRATGASSAEAADLTQQFVTDVVLERDLIDRASPERGRFRTFLRAAVRNFLVDQHRRAKAQRRHPELPILSIDTSRIREVEPSILDSPERAFDRQWAATVMQQAMESVRVECERGNMTRHWAVFEAAVLTPALQGGEAPLLREVSERLGCADVTQASNMIQTIRRRLNRTIRSIIADSLDSTEELESELSWLKELLGLPSQA